MKTQTTKNTTHTPAPKRRPANMKKETIYECFRCRERHSTENVSPTCAKCVYDQKFKMQNTILEQGRIIDRLRAQVVEAKAKVAELEKDRDNERHLARRWHRENMDLAARNVELSRRVAELDHALADLAQPAPEKP